MSEHQQQVAVVEWFRLQHRDKLIFAIPNGTFIRSIGMRVKAKREGLTKGIPDLMIPYPCGKYHGLFIEMKDIKKTPCSQSKEQKEKIKQLNELGYFATWAAGSHIAILIIKKYLGDL